MEAYQESESKVLAYIAAVYAWSGSDDALQRPFEIFARSNKKAQLTQREARDSLGI